MVLGTDPVFKIIIAGEQSVGKTTIIKRFVDGMFLKDTKTTIGVDFSLKTVSSDKAQYILQIWDVAGEERFRQILPHYLPGTEGVILAFDATRLDTLDSLKSWISVIKENTDKDPPYLLISTKNDLFDFKNSKLIEDFSNKFPEVKGYVSTSSQSGLGVEETFNRIASLIKEKYKI